MINVFVEKVDFKEISVFKELKIIQLKTLKDLSYCSRLYDVFNLAEDFALLRVKTLRRDWYRLDEAAVQADLEKYAFLLSKVCLVNLHQRAAFTKEALKLCLVVQKWRNSEYSAIVS